MKTNQSFFVHATNNAAAANANDIRALKPPVEIPNLWLWIWVLVGIIALIAIVITFLVFVLRNKTPQSQITPAIPPHERARLKLQEALALLSQPQPFCVLVSDTVRIYLEERFRFHAPERTTEEFLHELQATDLLLADQKASLGEFLSICDMVKFARYEPGQTELQALHESAVRLIDETEPQPPVPETNASALS